MKDMRLLHIDESLLRFFAWKAASDYGEDCVKFNSASFSNVLCNEIGFTQPVDGLKVQMILCGRPWLEQIDNCTWKLKR